MFCFLEPAAAEGEEEEEEPPVAEGYRVLINMKDTVKNKTLQVCVCVCVRVPSVAAMC